MQKGLKKAISLLLCVLLVVCSMPLTVFAQEVGSTLTVFSNVEANGVEIDEDVSFDYQVVIGGRLYDGVAKGSDGNDYNIVNGKLTLPYNVKAVIGGLEDGTDYIVKRLAYDNPKYALVAESAVVTGSISAREYYKTVNGKRTQIDAEIYNRETDGGQNLTRFYYLGQDGVEYDTANTGSFVTYDISRAAVVNTPDGYSVITSNYSYADITEYNIKISNINIGKYSKTFGKCTATGNPSATVSTDYSADITSSNTQSVVAALVSESSVQRQLFEGLQLAEAVGVDDVLSKVSADSGKTAVISESVLSPVYGDTSELTTKMYVINELAEQNVSYEAVSVEANKVAEFDVALEKAPTGTVCVDFILDATVPEAFSGAVFEIRNADGTLLTEGTDYTLSAEDVSINILSSSIGFTRYTFSELLSGDYTLQQVTGASGYAVDTTKYAFSVARADGSISGDHVKGKQSMLGDPASVISNDVKDYKVVKLNIFSNKSFSFKFTTLDQNDEPVKGAQFFMVERNGLIDLIKTLAKYGIDTAGSMDWGALLESLTSGGSFSLDAETIVKLIASLAELSPEQLESVTLPAILIESSGADGITEFDNNSNILNALDLLSGLGDVKGSDLANLLKKVLSGVLPENVLSYLDVLSSIETTIKVHAGVPTGSYLLIEGSAPEGYKRNSSMYTITVASSGEAIATTGVLLPLIADYIDQRLGFDIYDLLISEEEFENASQQIKQLFGTFDNYMNSIVDSVLDFVDANFGDMVDLGAVDRIRNSINSYYEQYDDFSMAIADALRDFNKSIVDDFTEEWVFENERIFVDVVITVADCMNKDISGATVTVTDVNDPDNKYTALDENGNAYLHYGTYTVTVSDLDSKYVLLPDTDDEGNNLYVNPVTIVIDDDHNTAQTVNFYYHEDAGLNHMDDPTCTTDGLDIRSCALCSNVFEEKVLPATGHDYKESTVEATCTSDGYIEKICANCGDVQREYTDELKAAGHDYDLISSKAADHENAGYEIYKCKNCDDTYTVITEALGHNELKESARKDATCTEKGYIEYTCSDEDCDYTETVDLPALGHNLINVDAKAPTCTEDGYTESVVCERCSHVEKAPEKLAAPGHSYKVTVTAPTCTEEGEIVHECAVCGDTKTESIDPTGHAYKETYVEPTCEEDGKTIITCLRCDYRAEVIDQESALGHDYKDRVINPTCTTPGVTIRTCARCNDVVEINPRPALGHHVVTDPAIEPTCTESGWTEGSHCDRCNMIQGGVGVYQEEIPALGHIVVVDEHVDPTCTQDGLMSGSHCDRCHEVLVEQISIPALGHVPGHWKIVKFPTCEESGLLRKSCERCGETIKEKTLCPVKIPVISGDCKCGDPSCCDGSCICLCNHSIKYIKIITKLHRVFSKLFKFFGIPFPELCRYAMTV